MTRAVLRTLFIELMRDRGAISKQLENMPESERTLLPDVVKTVDGLYQRAQYLALRRWQEANGKTATCFPEKAMLADLVP